ncbi:MAG TPA: hypothetical protein VF385_00920 [Patescibacteria group bacterium]
MTIIILWNVFKNTTSQKINNRVKQNTETIEFERSKDFSFIKVFNIVDTLKGVDAFGNKLKIGEWYVQSNITRSVFPINTKSTNYTNLNWLMANGKKELARVKITNGEPLGAYVDVEILLLGNKVLVLNDLERYQVISIK